MSCKKDSNSLALGGPLPISTPLLNCASAAPTRIGIPIGISPPDLCYLSQLHPSSSPPPAPLSALDAAPRICFFISLTTAQFLQTDPFSIPKAQPFSGYACCSPALARSANLRAMGFDPVIRIPDKGPAPGECTLLAWGRKPKGIAAQKLAEKTGHPLLWLEDGFLRSVGLGNHEEALSIVWDDCGIYYDATAPSRIENLARLLLSQERKIRATALQALWCSLRLSKYNHAREWKGKLPEKFVLAVDQTHGDASLNYGMAGANAFQQMLETALCEFPDCVVLLKTHPEVVSGRKKGCVNLTRWKSHPRVQIFAEDAHAPSLIEHAEAVFTATSQVGFEGLLWSKPVFTFGMPFYAGWGLTTDFLQPPGRRSPVALEALIHAALVDYPLYLHPETKQLCTPEDLMQWMGLQRSMRERFPAKIHAVGFSPWKRPVLRSFLAGSTVTFRRWSNAEAEATAVWGKIPPPPQTPLKPPLLRVEDGFLRSVGLGAALVEPVSWVVDSIGIYYDASSPSALEHLLSTITFPPELIERARQLRERIRELRITKYNTGGGEDLPDLPVDTRVLLVPGQVEGDASIRFGSPQIHTNLGLLQAVRKRNPNAFVIYKPHPDVVAGLRDGGAGESEAGQWCDLFLPNASITSLLDRANEIHTLTSLAGFEAMLRGRKVVPYGQPFYAGWGLTEDIFPPARRGRKLSLDELVAATLILYPTYVSRATGHFTTPERALEEIVMWREKNPAPLGPVTARLQRWTRAVRALFSSK